MIMFHRGSWTRRDLGFASIEALNSAKTWFVQ